MTLQDYREEVERAAERLRACGERDLEVFDGLELLGPEDEHHLPDELHPDGDGYELMGRRAAEKILPRLLGRL